METTLNTTQSFFKFLQENTEDFIVVGSLALKACGIELKEASHDIDVIVKCNEAQQRVFSLLSQTETRNNDYNKDSKDYPLFFKWKGVTVNVWTKWNQERDFIIKDQIKYATVFETLKEKFAYKRQKDIDFKLHLLQTIINL